VNWPNFIFGFAVATFVWCSLGSWTIARLQREIRRLIDHH
jgi:hypothetical protein